MEITIKINGRFLSVEVSAEVADYLEQAKRNNQKLYRERQRCWRSAHPPSGSGFRSMPCMILVMRRLPRCAAAPKFPFARASRAFAKSFSISLGKHTNDCPPKWLPCEGRLLHHWEGQAVLAVCPSRHLVQWYEVKG